ncbi:MAG: hypothetical protein F4Y84_01870 [Caldilineaceae bacterium SB0665_bin_25]|nr:hypothetical protein [Caldilineaceae bacterium SB0665_bin_25]
MQSDNRIRVGVSRLFACLRGRKDIGGRIACCAVLLGLCALSVIALNSADALAHESNTTWDADNWHNMTLTGNAVISREDETLDFDWGDGSPGTGISGDRFSARWERHLDISADEAGNYIFTVEVDDGVRLWVDDVLQIDSWIEQAKASYEAKLHLSEGQHLIRVEYYELAGAASISVSWEREPDLPTTYWRGEYYNNSSLTGTAHATRDEARLDFDWGYESPLTGINQDGFSVRWSRSLQLPAGDYRFTVTVDDGVRLIVGDRTLIDFWQVQTATTYSQITYLDGSAVTVRMEYFEETGQAQARLTWSRLETSPTSTPDPASTPGSTTIPPASPTPPATYTPAPTATPATSAIPTSTQTITPTPTSTPVIVWQALYWNNRTLTGTPVLARQESAVDYNWGTGSPEAQTINADSFSARWTAQISLEAGTYRFDVVSDDGVRLFIDGVKQIDGWSDHPATTYQYTLQHDGGSLSLILEYYEHEEAAQVKLSWAAVSAVATPEASPSPAPTPITVVVDDQDSGFQRGGLATTWQEETVGHSDHLFWTNNNDKTRTGYNWGRWSPDLEAASYKVFVYIPSNHATTGNARYWISHSGGFTLREVDQSQHSDQWVSLGTYTFSGTDEDYISLSDVTYETYLSTKVAWDAMKWEKQ